MVTSDKNSVNEMHSDEKSQLVIKWLFGDFHFIHGSCVFDV